MGEHFVLGDAMAVKCAQCGIVRGSHQAGDERCPPFHQSPGVFTKPGTYENLNCDELLALVRLKDEQLSACTRSMLVASDWLYEFSDTYDRSANENGDALVRDAMELLKKTRAGK